MWTGVSAHPDRRVKPKANLGALPHNDKEAVAFARKTYDADLGNGYHSKIDGSETHLTSSGTVYVKGAILFNGRPRGFFERTLYLDDKGALVAHHETLIIDGYHKGLGVADRFNAHAVAEYQKLGVDRITLKAGDPDLYVGAYAWARQGFRYDGSDGARRAYLSKQLSRIDVQLLKPVLREHAVQVRKEVAALKRAVDAGEDVQPIHVASVGEKYARHQDRDTEHFEYTTWPGKSVLLGTSWNGVYYFDASRAITAAATDLEHAALRPAFRTEDLSFNPRQPRDKDGKWTVSVQHIANQENAAAILKGGFSTDTPAWDRSFGGGVYLSEAGDAKSAKFYARQGGRNWRTAQVIEGSVSLSNPLHIEAKEHSNFRAEVVRALGGTAVVRDLAQAKYDHTVAVTKKIVAEELGPDHGVDLTHPESVYWVHYEDTPGTAPSVSQRVENASERIHQRIKEETGGSPTENGSWRYLAEGIEKIAKPGVNTSSDNYSHYSELIGNLARDHGYDGIVINTNRWGGVGGQQIVVFDPSTIKVTGSHPYARTASAAHLVEALACHDAACAPPPAGVGGSSPAGALQARRGVVPGYGAQARRDIHLAGVRVTYHPDFPDDHPDPGEVVWAKVRYQEDVNQSKDRPVLIIGRINGTNKLAAVQLTSQINGRPNQHVVGPGSWDRFGRNAAVKLDQIIVVDPKDYRREGSTFERARFDDVIGRLAAYHRTPVTIAASGEHLHWSGGIEFACHDSSCRPPTSGGTGGSRPGGGFPNGANPEARYTERLRSIGITDSNNIGPEYKDRRDDQLAHNFRSLVPEDLHGAVRVRVGAHHIEEILADGLKTQHDTGTSGGIFSPVRRDQHEAVMFAAPNTRPIYGYIKTTVPTMDGTSGQGQYGAFAIVLKDSVAHRTTVTYGDSLGSEDFPAAPIPVHNVHNSTTMRINAAVLDRTGDKPRYVEAQIHGKVKPSDIDHIEFDPHEDPDRIARVKQAAQVHGIPVIEPTEHYTGTYGDDEVHFGANT